MTMTDTTTTTIDAEPTPREKEQIAQSVSLGDWVRVHNVGDEPLTISWDSREYVIPVNEEKFVPFEAAKLWFGDPRAQEAVRSHKDVLGVVSWIPDRATEVRRLRALYDNQFGDETKITNHPQVQVYTQEGHRVYTVLDDAKGERVIPAATSQFDFEQLMATIQKQQRMIDVLMSRTANVEEVLRRPEPEVNAEPAITEEPYPTTAESRVPMTDDDVR